jgi:hypothetical protein
VRISSQKPSAEQLALMDDLKAAIAEHSELAAVEMLAVVSILVGNLLALQDTTQGTAQEYTQIVVENIQLGNATAISTFLGTPVGSA